MESSSNDSFAWTDASNVSTDSGVMAVDNTRTLDNKVIDQSGNESEYGKSYKKKLQKELFAYNEDNHENEIQKDNKRKRDIRNERSEEENIESPRKKKIKLEPESDFEASGKKRKSKQGKNGDGNPLVNISKGALLNDDSYLNLRVKEEMAFKVPSPTVTTKKKKRKDYDLQVKIDNDIDTELSDISTSIQSIDNDISSNDISEISQTMDSNENQCKGKKKKKKKKKRKGSDEADYVSNIDKFSAEESFVETEYISNGNQCDNSTEEQMRDENTSQNRNNSWNSNINNSDSNKARYHANVRTDALQSETMSDEGELQVHSEEKLLHEGVEKKTFNNHNMPVKTNPRKSRISERIRFEEDNLDVDVTNYDDKDVDSRSRKLEKFLKVNENLKPIPGKLKKKSILTIDDEIWMVRCPHNISVNAFQDVTISLDKKCKIKVDENTYEGSVEDHMSTVTVLSQVHSKFILKNLSSKGIINFRKRVPKVHIPYDTMMLNNQNDFIPLPETKVRHPLFGSNYKKAIKISKAVKERLAASDTGASDEINNKRRQSKTNHISKDVYLESFVEAKHEPEPIEESLPKKKSKKRKHSRGDKQPFIKQIKRKKHETNNSAEVWDSEKAIEESLFNF